MRIGGNNGKEKPRRRHNVSGFIKKGIDGKIVSIVK
jgi:hypothetical protein